MNGVLVCKTCLITNVKMFPLVYLANAYSDLTGLQCDDSTVEFVCYQCAAILLKFQQFRTKCLKANEVILEFIKKHCKITETVLNAIDRKFHKLESTINKCEINENIFTEIYYEAKLDTFKNERPEESFKIEIDDVIEAIEIKDKVEIYDDKDQDVSDGNESLHLEDDINIEDKCSLKDDVKNKTGDESIEISQNGEHPINNIEHYIDQRTNSSKLQNKSREKIKKSDKKLLDEYVTIVNLTPEQAKQELLLRKESTNYKNNLYKCDLCYRGFGTPQTYQNHMKRHNEEIGEYCCDCCHVMFSNRLSLKKHIYNYHTMKILCKHCPFIGFNLTSAYVHINFHKGKKYPCPECDLIFKMPSTLQTHQSLKHISVSSEFVCAMCGNIFGKQRGLIVHINRLHKQDINEQQGPLCEECDVHFATETAWKRHLVLSSKHTVSNGCEVCGETYESKDALKRHARVHFPIIKSQSRKKKNRTLFDMKVTTKPEASLQCEVCGKMYKSASFYICHQKIHTDERPYSCTLCPNTFVYRNSLDKHLKMHRGIRPHKCDVCGKTFLTPCEVKYHIQHTHQKVPWPKRNRSKRKKIDRASSSSTSS